MSKNYFMNGITDLLILSLLNGKDRYMYEIVKCIEDFSDGLKLRCMTPMEFHYAKTA